MFSEKLQNLIDASLVDGVITDKERAVIHKRALQEGVDPDEVDVMLDAEIEKMRQHQESAVKKVKKCPNCGEVIPVMAIKCNSCGYEFRDVEANKSVKELFHKINEVYSSKRSDEQKEEQIRMLIENFPIPTTKEDILEFLFTGIPKSQINNSLFAKLGGGIMGMIICIIGMVLVGLIGGKGQIREAIGMVAFIIILAWWIPVGFVAIFWYFTREKHADIVKKNRMAAVWRSKCEQVIMKAKFTMGDDPKLLEKIKDFEDRKSKFRLF